jgi:hypothetical protein
MAVLRLDRTLPLERILPLDRTRPLERILPLERTLPLLAGIFRVFEMCVNERHAAALFLDSSSHV